MNNKLLLAAALATGASSCGNLRAIHHGTHFSYSGQEAFFIDAQQRAVLYSGVSGNNRQPAMCTEPSPDAISALSAAASSNLSSEEVGRIQASFAMTESAASIGLRTPTIQLLRDGMYRLCEGYLNGALSRDNYVTLINRYQEMMIGLVAIEQLTGVVRASNVAIRPGDATATSSFGGNVEGAVEDQRFYTEQMNEARIRMDGLPRPTGVAEEAASDQARRDAIARAKSEFDMWSNLASTQGALVGRLRESEQARRTAADAAARGAGGANFGSISGDGGQSADAVRAAAVAQSVERIAQQITQNNLLTVTCGPVLTERARYLVNEPYSLVSEDVRACRDMVRVALYRDLARNLRPDDDMSIEQLIQAFDSARDAEAAREESAPEAGQRPPQSPPAPQ